MKKILCAFFAVVVTVCSAITLCACNGDPAQDCLHFGHTEVTDARVVPTCTETGLTEGKHCSACGEVLVAQEIIPVLGHEFVEGICTRCGSKKPSEGLAFALSSDGKSYSVTGIGTCTDTDLVIPDLYNNLPVTSIERSAFSDCSSLTRVTIPDSVTRIGSFAFFSCDNLTRVDIPDGVASIGLFAPLRTKSLP